MNRTTQLGAAFAFTLLACGSSDASAPTGDAPTTHDDAGSTDSGSGVKPGLPPEHDPTTDAGTATEDTGAPSTSHLPAPPDTWKEHWFEHNQLLKLDSFNDDVALYFDDDIDRTRTKWMLPYLTKVWQYTRKTYPGLGPDRLFAVFHQGRYSGGHPSTHFDDSHDNRNVIDCGGDNWNDGAYDMPTHEIGHIVESASNNHHGSPAFPLWQDSKWMEFFLYDVYSGLGMQDQATRWYGEMLASGHTDDFPVAGTRWFKNWFYPLWHDDGGSAVMAGFFALLARDFPTNGGVDYARDMNWGEYVHFTSGAAHKDLKPLATAAFGWPAEWETQYQKAKKDFPKITY